MARQLSDSALDRQNILNNPFALDTVQKQVGITGYPFDGEYKFTLKQVADFYEVDSRTVSRYLANNTEELRLNGYTVYSGSKLDQFLDEFATDINVSRKVRNLGLFNFRAFLNLGMLLVESEKARMLRGLLLDIAIDVMSAKAGGNTKYINQRDDSYLVTSFLGEGYRNEFKEALNGCVDMGNFKYAVYTNKIYKSIFKEHAGEYRNILSLTKKENVRDTMYAEVLTTISMYETGLAHELTKKCEELGRKLTTTEVDNLFTEFENNPTWAPQIEMARMKMASRDYGFRSVIHPELADYVNPINTLEFDRFLGEKSAELGERIKQYQDVFKRLKDK